MMLREPTPDELQTLVKLGWCDAEIGQCDPRCDSWHRSLFNSVWLPNTLYVYRLDREPQSIPVALAYLCGEILVVSDLTDYMQPWRDTIIAYMRGSNSPALWDS